jgi:hypothetical protein
VRCVAAAGGEADTSSETPSEDDLNWRRVILDGQLLNERIIANGAATCTRYINSDFCKVASGLSCGSVCGDVDTSFVAEIKEILLREMRVHSAEG